LWPGTKYKPTLGHYFIKLLNDKGKLLRCFTQNIDSLEGMTGLPKDKIVAAHGNFDSASCVLTNKKVPIDDVKEAYLKNKHDELNKKHGTKLVKPDIVFFGESLPDRFGQLSARDFPQCDFLIVMGTSLKVYPFAALVGMVNRTAPRVLINRERAGNAFSFSKESRDLLMEGDCDDGCWEMACALGWGEELKEITKLQPL